ncbi:membrane fusion protein, multidrug efflux system [Roseateles sp. YR242]|uniref:efflux RND transporter periplasmic adaptor subunit n=1 Tax=Roseateles sp. YR242 TaxID=1855305 RepID=UPI0008B994F4|nr:efflux RND transporter periplasmic adaptor subunit [Roseateles sp. YR242]SEL84152.1 membrane fusion protein, multidrug efflux system [Roseateles sp. YR242]
MKNLLNRRRPFAITATSLTAIAAVVAAGVVGLHSQQAEANPPAAAPQAIPVSVATVTTQDVAAWEEFSGRLEAVERVDVRSRVAGAVQSVNFREGSLVKAGELLITIDPAPFQAEVDRADAQVVAAQARVSYTKSELERSTRLWSEHAIAQRELDERSNASREADANLRAAQAALQSARLNLGYTQVRAPVAGRVGRIEVTQGNLVAAGPSAPVLTTLVSVSPIYASFDADERTVARALAELPGGGGARSQLDRIPVQIGTAATTDTPYTGRLQLVDNQVDARSGTVRVRAVLDNKDGALMPGQFARIRLGQSKSRPALLVNERAVGTDQSKRFVMVVGKDNTLSYREVQLGASVDGLRIVTAGLKPNETVVVNGLQRVRPGALVQPQVVPMNAKTELQAKDGSPKTDKS